MRSIILLPALAALVSASTPFSSPLQLRQSPNNVGILERANGNCPSNAASCLALGFAGYCCPTGTNCALDNSQHIACCPTSELCTGSIPTGVVVVPATQTIINPANAVSTVFNGASSVISVITTQYSDFRSDLGGWYTSLTSQFGPAYTTLLNAQGAYVSTIVEVVNNVATTTTVSVVLPTAGAVITGGTQTFVQAGGATATVTIIKGSGGMRTGGQAAGLLVGVIGMCVAAVGWVI